MTIDQRAAGFNYGIGWGSVPKPRSSTKAYRLPNVLTSKQRKHPELRGLLK